MKGLSLRIRMRKIDVGVAKALVYEEALIYPDTSLKNDLKIAHV